MDALREQIRAAFSRDLETRQPPQGLRELVVHGTIVRATMPKKASAAWALATAGAVLMVAVIGGLFFALRTSRPPALLPATSPAVATVSASPSPSGGQVSPSPSGDLGCAFRAPRQVPSMVLPADAICVSSVRGNFDGASRDEAVAVYGLPDRPGPAHAWYVRAVLGDGRSITADLLALSGRTGLTQTAVQGVADPDGSGRDKAFIQIDCGASTCFVGILGVDAGTLHFVRVASGPDRGKLAFAVGGTVTHQDRLECTNGTGGRLVTTRTFSSPDAGQHFTWRVLTYRMQGLDLSLTNQAQGTVTSVSDPHLAFSNVVDCPPLLLPPFGG